MTQQQANISAAESSLNLAICQVNTFANYKSKLCCCTGRWHWQVPGLSGSCTPPLFSSDPSRGNISVNKNFFATLHDIQTLISAESWCTELISIITPSILILLSSSSSLSSSPSTKHSPLSALINLKRIPCQILANLTVHCYNVLCTQSLWPQKSSALCIISSSIKGGPRWPKNCSQQKNQSVLTENTLCIKNQEGGGENQQEIPGLTDTERAPFAYPRLLLCAKWTFAHIVAARYLSL